MRVISNFMASQRENSSRRASLLGSFFSWTLLFSYYYFYFNSLRVKGIQKIQFLYFIYNSRLNVLPRIGKFSLSPN